MDNETEISLINWRGGQTKAERLCAALLSIEGYHSIDPQCPLGGPDGLKDIVCVKDSWKYIGASYFPTTGQQFKSIKEKFEHDLDGVSANNANGLVFFTNQKITPKERTELEETAEAIGQTAQIYHVERIRALLDAPKGYGLRLEYLKIEMTKEEQLDFWSNWRGDFLEVLQRHELKFDAIVHKLDILFKSQSAILNEISGNKRKIERIDKEMLYELPINPDLSGNLTFGLLSLIHRLITKNELPEMYRGVLRQDRVWIGGQNSTIRDAIFVPIEPFAIPEELNKLFENWNNQYEGLKKSKRDEKVKSIAKFHADFISIHPFLDGNGRVSRVILNQQIMDLFNGDLKLNYPEGKVYYNALSAANSANLQPLINYFETILRENLE